LDKYGQDLMIKVSELYYIHEMTQQQIANRLRISRVKVSRILTNAKKRGIIEININYPIDNCVKLERKFEKLFNLKEALIISNKYKSREIIYNEVTRIAAKYLLKIIQNGDVLGVSWLRTLNQMSNYIKYSGKKVDIVQMLGNVGSNDVSADEIVRRLSNAFNGKHYFLPAPAIVDNEKIKNTIMSDSSITQVFRKMKEITVAIVGIGNLIKESTFVTSGYLKKSDIDFLRKSNSVGDICGRFFDENGNVNDTCFNRRVIGIDLEQLKKIPYVIGVVSGSQKAMAILGALRSGVLDVLITDEDTALEVYQNLNR
jgi:DNA-binding transcriptional regulator LsrR (DeoR family)